MIDIFHISRICCKGTNYLRYYRKCVAVFISRGLFLRWRGFSLADFADDFSYLSQISQISRIFLSHRLLTDFAVFWAAVGLSLTDFTFFYLTDFAVFGVAVGYRSQISQILRIFLSHGLLTCSGYSLRNSKLKTNVLWRLQSVLSVKSV